MLPIPVDTWFYRARMHGPGLINPPAVSFDVVGSKAAESESVPSDKSDAGEDAWKALCWADAVAKNGKTVRL